MVRNTLLASAFTLSLSFTGVFGSPVDLSATTAGSTATTNDQQVGNILAGLAEAQPTTAPTSVPDAAATIKGINTGPLENPSDWVVRATELINNGFTNGSIAVTNATTAPSVDAVAAEYIKNPPPKTPIYPFAAPGDAPYDVKEWKLRKAIKIPHYFTFGQKPPVILFPGTGATGYSTYIGNFIKLLKNKDYADAVWVDVPHYLLDDAQVNAEYAAYAINYISSITSRNVSVIAWSQGNLDNQWALKYWPSTRSKVSDLVAMSPDFHGTKLAYTACLGPQGLLACTPAVIQQEYKSKFVHTLRSNGGDSAYVPTTSVFSSTDEIVQPQSGRLASAYIQDARGVGVSNTEIQTVCGDEPAGGSVTHEGVLYNALGVALALDALKNPGPGSLRRIDVQKICSMPIAKGLNKADLVTTEKVIVDALFNVLTYKPKTLVEPRIKAYARYGGVAAAAEAAGAAADDDEE